MEITSVLFAGVGGQGIILASKILAKCAFVSGYMVKESELHGMAQRGGSVTSHVRFGEEVYSPLIHRGKADFLVALEELEGLRYAYYLKSNGKVILNHRRIMPSSINLSSAPYPEDVKSQLESIGFHVDDVNALEIAKNLGNLKVENIILIGMLSLYLPFPLSAWEMVIKESVPVKTIEINLTAFEKGREITEGKG
ncbi:MAG: indolepyruvate oxidoreductase subunit beta [Nitrospirota bacterium]|nr:indolepyruvate oxidoreductase subunit beta [Nitrospirota bacterium]